MDKDAETFMAVTGASHSESLRKLEAHGGNLNAAVDAFFNESENIPPQERHDEIPLNSRTEGGEPTRGQFLNHRSFRSVDPFWAPFNSFKDLHKRLFHEDMTFYNSSGSEQMKNTREILIDWKEEDHGGLPRINRVPHRPISCSGPEVCHPKEVREIVIEWKENNAESSHAPHAPIIEEIPEDEHGVYEAGLEGNVTVVDDDIPSSASTIPGDAAYANISGGDSREGVIQITELPVASYKEDYDQEEKMLQAAIEASKREAEESKRRQHHDFTQGAVGSRVDQCDEIVSAVSLSTKEAGRQHEAKVASIPPEPPVEVENAVNLLVRMPDGTTCCHRFLGSNKLQSLFDFIDVAGGAKLGNYSLVRHYPRRMFTRKEGNYTLNQLGLTNKQEALFLESL